MDSLIDTPRQQLKTVLITGAGNGIGEETAHEFARRGYQVAVCDIDSEAAERTAAGIRSLGMPARAWRCDVRQSADVRLLIDEVVACFGRIDAAFNNAGIGGGRHPFVDIDETEFDNCLQTNLKGTLLCMQYEMRHMLAAGGGVIINNCSIAGLRASVGAAYSASKHAVAGLTRSAALTYASKGIRVNAVCPGLIEAGLGNKLLGRDKEQAAQLIASIPAGRAGTALDIARAVIWLASDESSYMHGQMVTIDGGYSLQ